MLGSMSQPVSQNYTISCPVCDSTKTRQLPISAGGQGPKLLPRTVAECDDCHHKFCPESVDDDLIKAWYQGDWYFQSNCHHQNINDIADEAQWRDFLAARHAVLEQFGLNPSKGQGRAVLEIGCLEGRLVRSLSDQGWQAEGIEINRDVAERGAANLGVTIHILSVSDWQPKPEKFDAVISFHTFEHLIDPLEALKKIYLTLKPGGQCLLEVPCDDEEFDNPDHLHFFSENSGQTLMQRVFGNSKILANRYTDAAGRRLGSLYVYAKK